MQHYGVRSRQVLLYAPGDVFLRELMDDLGSGRRVELTEENTLDLVLLHLRHHLVCLIMCIENSGEYFSFPNSSAEIFEKKGTSLVNFRKAS